MTLEPSVMGFRPLSALVMFALGGIMMATSSVQVDSETGEVKFIQGSMFMGAFVLLFGIYLGVTSVI